MRSLIILEVEHDDTTDPLQSLIRAAIDESHMNDDCKVLDYHFRVDLPECFRLDK